MCCAVFGKDEGGSEFTFTPLHIQLLTDDWSQSVRAVGFKKHQTQCRQHLRRSFVRATSKIVKYRLHGPQQVLTALSLLLLKQAMLIANEASSCTLWTRYFWSQVTLEPR